MSSSLKTLTDMFITGDFIHEHGVPIKMYARAIPNVAGRHHGHDTYFCIQTDKAKIVEIPYRRINLATVFKNIDNIALPYKATSATLLQAFEEDLGLKFDPQEDLCKILLPTMARGGCFDLNLIARRTSFAFYGCVGIRVDIEE